MTVPPTVSPDCSKVIDTIALRKTSLFFCSLVFGLTTHFQFILLVSLLISLVLFTFNDYIYFLAPALLIITPPFN